MAVLSKSVCQRLQSIKIGFLFEIPTIIRLGQALTERAHMVIPIVVPILEIKVQGGIGCIGSHRATKAYVQSLAIAVVIPVRVSRNYLITHVLYSIDHSTNPIQGSH